MTFRFRRTATAFSKSVGIAGGHDASVSLRCPHCKEATTIFGGTALDAVFVCPACNGTFAFTVESTAHTMELLAFSPPPSKN